MTIEDPALFVASLVDWAILDGCWGLTRIRPTDVDGSVERFDAHLRLERKMGAHLPVKVGQDRDLRSYSRHGHTVVVFWTTSHDSASVVRVRVYYAGEAMELATGLAGLRAVVSAWFRLAELGLLEDQIRLQSWALPCPRCGGKGTT